jgi:hypothetical protein
VIDNALVVWHSDYTEIMNSGRPPQDGDFCLGVWEQVGKSKYKLNHFAWGARWNSRAPVRRSDSHHRGGHLEPGR